MKRIITLVAILVMAITLNAQTSSEPVSMTIDGNYVSFYTEYTPFGAFSNKVKVNRSGFCEIQTLDKDDVHITTYTSIENKFQVSIIETKDSFKIVVSYYVYEQGRETVKLVTINY